MWPFTQRIIKQQLAHVHQHAMETDKLILELKVRADNIGICDDCGGVFARNTMQEIECKNMPFDAKPKLLYCKSHSKPYDVIERRSKGKPFSGYDVYFKNQNPLAEVTEKGKPVKPNKKK